MNIILEKLKNLIGIAAILREGHKMAKTEGNPSLINIFGLDDRDFEQGNVDDIEMFVTVTVMLMTMLTI